MIEGPFTTGIEGNEKGFSIEATRLPIKDGRKVGLICIGLNIQPNGMLRMRELTIADLVAIGKAAGLPDEASAEFYQGPKAPGKAHKVNKRKFTEKERIDITKLWAEESRATDHQGANHKLASEYGCSAMQINGLILQLRRKGWLVKAKSGGHKLSKLGLQERDNFQRRSSGQRRKA